MAKDGPVQRHGRLRTANGRMIDESGEPVQLRGMSSHGMQWYPGFLNTKSMEFLRDTWGAHVIRFAMYLDEGGYMKDGAAQKKLTELMEAAVLSAIRTGMYAVIDWHVHPYEEKYPGSGDPRKYQSFAVEFFQSMARKFSEFPNLIYEVTNEPGRDSKWDEIRTYAEEVVDAIRGENSDNLVVVGTPFWSQHVDIAAKNPLNAENIAYALHFYAGRHGEELRTRIKSAMDSGQTVFVTEWGTTDETGKGAPRKAESREWIQFLNQRGISWINWSLSDANEESAALRVGTQSNGGWSDSQLSASGLLVRELMLAR